MLGWAWKCPGTYLVIGFDFFGKGPFDAHFVDALLKDVAAALNHRNILPHVRRYAGHCNNLISLSRHSRMRGGYGMRFEDGKRGFHRQEFGEDIGADYVLTPFHGEQTLSVQGFAGSSP